MTDHVPIMMVAVVIAVIVHAAGRPIPLANFIDKNPTIVMLALGFLLMIGMVLIADGFGVHVPKGYIYAAMAFSALVEGLNMMGRKSPTRSSAAAAAARQAELEQGRDGRARASDHAAGGGPSRRSLADGGPRRRAQTAPHARARRPRPRLPSSRVYGYEVVRDAIRMTPTPSPRGWSIVDGVLFESTGRYPSTIRRVRLEDGVVLAARRPADRHLRRGPDRGRRPADHPDLEERQGLRLERRRPEPRSASSPMPARAGA